ncbi:unnamed protein product [Cladocopium goreaui]|uniref:Uncharacterized protein n=1 Tax=Cladocopium goreaui TaxID=2562237 RepID=A0A9P1DJU8_9DINO|nr:unnamed protein product [Cladocopium goreaui]
MPSKRLKDLLRLGLGSQSIKHPPLVPEYKDFIHLDEATPNPAYKLLAAPPQQGPNDTEQQEPEEAPNKRPRTTFKYGVWHEPEEFLQKAADAKHPIDQDSFLHQITKEAIAQVVGTCPTKMAKERLSTVFHVRKMATSLKSLEVDLKADMHPDVSRCVRSKNILLFEKLLHQLDFWDMDAVNLLKFGVPIVGMQEPPKGYQQLLLPASITEDELIQSAKWRRDSLMKATRALSKSEEDALTEATAMEVDKGFLQGPCTEEEMSVLMGTDGWSLNPRFVLFQGSSQKVRVIDDAKQSAVNAAYSSTVKLQLQDVDYAAAMVLGAMRELLKAITSHYFDDFPTIERSEGCRVLTLAFSALLDLLGWDHAKEGDKALNFAADFDLLGVTFNLGEMRLGTLTISNKRSRVEKLCAMLAQVEKEGCITPAKASELQGLLNFAVSFYLGRSLKHVVSAFMPFADRSRVNNKADLVNLCSYTRAMLLDQRPRVHSVLSCSSPVAIFTDGAWEGGEATAGAVLIDGQTRLAFKILVPRELVDHWLRFAGDQIISQVELWALVCLKWSQKERLLNRRVIEWIDNEAARISVIKANSSSPTMRSLSRIMADIDLKWPTFSWTERVCSYSNPADLPSRDRMQEAMEKYHLENGGTIEAPAELTQLLIQLHQHPYNAAHTEGGTSLSTISS